MLVLKMPFKMVNNLKLTYLAEIKKISEYKFMTTKRYM